MILIIKSFIRHISSAGYKMNRNLSVVLQNNTKIFARVGTKPDSIQIPLLFKAVTFDFSILHEVTKIACASQRKPSSNEFWRF